MQTSTTRSPTLAITATQLELKGQPLAKVGILETERTRGNPRSIWPMMGVTRRTVINILQRFRRYGSVRPFRIGRPNIMSSITRAASFMLMEYVMRYPGAYLREAINYIEGICGREFSASSVCRLPYEGAFVFRVIINPYRCHIPGHRFSTRTWTRMEPSSK